MSETAVPNDELLADLEEAMRDVVDPELGINVVDLGLVYGLTSRGRRGHVTLIDMTLTSAACPLTDVIEDQSRNALVRSGLVNEIKINWVWIPPWGPDKITEDGREQLRALGFHRLVPDVAGQQRRIHGRGFTVHRGAGELEHRAHLAVDRLPGSSAWAPRPRRGCARCSGSSFTSRPARLPSRCSNRRAPTIGTTVCDRASSQAKATAAEVVPSSSAMAATVSMTSNSSSLGPPTKAARAESVTSAPRRYLPERNPFFSGLHGTSAMPCSLCERRQFALDRAGQQRVLDLQRDQRRPALAAPRWSAPARSPTPGCWRTRCSGSCLRAPGRRGCASSPRSGCADPSCAASTGRGSRCSAAAGSRAAGR